MKNKLIYLCERSLKEKNLFNDLYKKRLADEIEEIEVQNDFFYFIDLFEKGTKYAKNENNLLVPYLLDIVSDFDIEKKYKQIQGEFPDIDTDFLPIVRDWLKNQWSQEQFGQEYVCSIGTYNTLGIKSAVLDMTGTLGYSKSEIQAITVTMEDKDDEGKQLTWDKAKEMYPAFKEYCEKYPDVEEAAKTLIGRNKSGGVHAGGLIISNKRIDGFVPLEVRGVTKDNPSGVIVSAWTEGQDSQDLQPVGLIKFDFLVVAQLNQIAAACNAVKKRHGIDTISGFPGAGDWSDTKYLNDKKSMEMAKNNDLKGVFQFDSKGIRDLVKKGKITCFDDLPAYSALHRPGPLNMGMGDAYCNRKNGSEKYELHPILKPILGPTHGVMIYQEQIMQILHKVGNIPLIFCEKIRKAISKKNDKVFGEYKKVFLDNGQKNLSWTEEAVLNLWNQMASFAEYGFNKCISGDMIVKSICWSPSAEMGKEYKEFYFSVDQIRPGMHLFSYNNEHILDEVVELIDCGEKEVFEVEFDNGYVIKSTMDHKFLCADEKYHTLKEIVAESLEPIFV